jgi:hypothetical protein
MMQRWDFAVLLLLGAAYLFLHADRIAAPPLGRDGWRESDVLMVGRNFCREDGSLFYPRIDQRGDGPGITGMEFPLLNYLEGKLACAGANQVAVGRGISLAFALAAIASIYLLTRTHRRGSAALLAASAFAFSPLVYYYGASLQPDLPSLSLALLALVVLERSLSRETRWGLYFLSAGAMALAILIKLPAIVFGLPAAMLVLERRSWRGPHRWQYLAYLPIAVLPGLLWYWHARHLQEQFGIDYFYLGPGIAELVAGWADPVFYRRIFLEQLFDVYAFPAISVLSLAALVHWRKRMPGWVLGMAIAALAYFFLAGSTAAYHYYYGLPAVPILCILAVAWTEEVASRWGPAVEWGVSLALVAMVALYGPHRTRHWLPPPEAEKPSGAAKALLDSVAPAGQRVALFSVGDPTLLWLMDRKGWIAPEIDPVRWAVSKADLPSILLLDGKRVGPELRGSLEEAFRSRGYFPLPSDPQVGIWIQR